LLVHPGGPFFARKDEGSWTIPKGAPEPEEAPRDTALREFFEEVGVRMDGELIELGSIRQKSGKVLQAFGLESDLPADFVLKSNEFELEWPPRSGRLRRFPEVDRAEFFSPEIAARKILEAQRPLLDRLAAGVSASRLRP
jgi:predicted NUDIX family NTP pyrophosphohydrolase